jgi:hypothetical protein
MLKEHIEKIYSRLEKTGLTEERDRNLFRLLKDFEGLSDGQKALVLPQLEKTLARHEQLGESRSVIGRFMRSLDEAANRLKAETRLKTLGAEREFH